MSQQPDPGIEPSFNQPPAEQVSMRASDADRKATIALLNRGRQEGRLNTDEFLDRVRIAEAANTQAELGQLTRDLVVIQDNHRADEQLPLNYPGAPAPMVYGSNAITAILSTREHIGSWSVPAHLRVAPMLGTIKLDLRQASFTSELVTIEIGGFMGTIKIWLPEGAQLADETHMVMAEIKIKGLTPPRPGAPRITLTGTSIMAETIIYGSGYVSLGDRIKGKF